MIVVFVGTLFLWQAQGDGLSPSRRARAEWFLRERLPCLGCHELEGEGGRVGPSLSGLKGTRTRAYVAELIRDPQATVPGTMMPKVPMSPATLELIVDYLTQRDPSAPPPASTNLHQPPQSSGGATSAGDPAALYGRFCSPCHGVGGLGDGYNARFLPIRPTAHADAAYMSARSDDALFDAVYAGGYVMNRSPRMPPFGRTLSREQIWALVAHMRTLCRCVGPSWSRDDR